jgi:hypothetical protein
VHVPDAVRRRTGAVGRTRDAAFDARYAGPFELAGPGIEAVGNAAATGRAVRSTSAIVEEVLP